LEGKVKYLEVVMTRLTIRKYNLNILYNSQGIVNNYINYFILILKIRVRKSSALIYVNKL